MPGPLPRDLPSLIAAVERGEEFRFRCFWGHRPSKDGRLTDAVFSQWWACRFEADGVSYTSAEQRMMAEKARLFGDEATLAQILANDDPGICKGLGRKISGYDDAAWAAVRFGVVVGTNISKFGQNPALRAYLLASGNDILVEASPVDGIWGIGLAAGDPRVFNAREWQGENLLGFALVAARAALRAGS
jgi:ribA/ribD-fused uncharacterized protein